MTDLLSPPRTISPTPPVKVTSSDIRSALKRRFPDPEYAVLFEVLERTGAAHSRSADALVMGVWPSRGLDLHGMEIKVDRYDWRRERERPEKAETIASYCDFWSIVTSPGVIGNIDEVPPAWGWMEMSGQKLVTVREPRRLEAKPCDRRFLASLLRQSSRLDEAMVQNEVHRRDEQREAEFEKRIAAYAGRRTQQADSIIKDVEAFEEAAGFKISDDEFRGWVRSSAEIGRAVKIVRELGLASAEYGSLTKLVASLRDLAAGMEGALKKAGIELPPPESSQNKERRRARKIGAVS